MGTLLKNQPRESMAIKFLQRLAVINPSAEQIQTMSAILTDMGIVFLKCAFNKKLSEQESACLYWVTRGKSTQEIAELLNVKRVTIRAYYERIKKKLECRTIAQAVFEGMRFNLIFPPFEKNI